MGLINRNGLIGRLRGRCPAGIDERVWSWARSHEHTGFTGSVRDDSFVADQTRALVSGLAREFRAETAWQEALAEVRAARHAAGLADDAPPEPTAGIGMFADAVTVERRWAEVDAERRFREQRRLAAEGIDAQGRLAAATVALEGAWTEAVDRLSVAARERRRGIDGPIEVLNDRLRYFGHQPVEPLGEEFTEELVREAVHLADPLAEQMVRRVLARC